MELGSCIRHIWYRCLYFFNSEAHHFNPKSIAKPRFPGQTAKVVLLLHALAAHRSCFIPLARTLKNAAIHDIYTINLTQTTEDPVPIHPLNDKIHELYNKYIDQGYTDVQFALIGHSLGALVSAKYIWRKWNGRKPPVIALFVSLGGKLKNHKNAFSWFCEDVKPEIELTYEAILSAPHKTKLYSVWGDQDALVSKESANIFGNSEREHTIKEWGHAGLVFSPEAQHHIIKWLKRWID